MTSRPWVRCSVALSVVLSLGLAGCSDDASLTPPSSSASASDRATEVQQVLAKLQRALDDQDAAAAESAGGSGAREQLAAMVDNVRTLALTEVSLRYVDDAAVDPATLAAFGPDARRVKVEVAYRLPPRWDKAVTRVETPFVFVPGTGGLLIAAIGGADGRTPLWMNGPVRVEAGARTLVISRAGAIARYSRLAEHAIADVGRVLPGWHGSLVLEIPGSETELDQALDASQEQYSNIAAVTASVDGSLVPGAPVHVFLNPRIFDGLGPRGSQVVLSHESTHVATEATFTEMPTWLLEGFADYVALAHAGIPVRTAASQILARIRRQGAPDHLPTADELAPTAKGLGATYEEAWLASRFIAGEYGEAKLVAFYRAVGGGSTAERAYRAVLGTTEKAFTVRWSADLNALAGGEAG